MKLLLIIFVLVISIMSISIISAVKSDSKELNEIDSALNYGSSSKLSSSGDTIFLPGTNLSVSEYLNGLPTGETFNSSIIAKNNSHWNVRCDYSIETDWDGNPIPQTFYSIVNRTSINQEYNATNYYNWQGYPQETFDFWSDTSSYYDGYEYESGGLTITVNEVDNFYLDGLGYFDAWKRSGVDQYNNPFMFFNAKSGLFLSAMLTFIIDYDLIYNLTYYEFNEPPEGSIESPLSGVVSNQLTIEWTACDNQSSTLNQTVFVSRDQSRELVASTGIISTGSHAVTVSTSSLLEGSGYYIELELNDGFITTIVNSNNTTFTIDRSSPVMQDIDPENNSVILPGSDITVTFDEEPEECYYKWDTLDFESITGNPAIINTPLNDGPHVLTVNATDIAGNSRLTNYRYIIDGSPPVFVQISPTNGSTRHSGTKITVQFIDNTGLGTNYYQWDTGANTTTLSPLPEGNGEHELFITAVDVLGNSKLYYFVFTTDDNLPGISLVSPQNNSEVKSSTRVSLVIFSGNGSIIYNWDGASNLTVNEGAVIQTPQDEGVHVLNVYVNSSLGDWVSDRFVFTVDNTPPSIEITAPQNGTSLKSGVAIHVTVTGSNGSLYYAWDGGTNSSIHYPQENVVYSPKNEGNRILYLYSSDIAGNWAKAVYEFIIDNTPPSITITAPENGGFYQSDVLLQYVNDTDIDSFYFDGISQDIPVNGHVFTSLSDGAHNLTLTAIDEAGNVFSITVTFTVDTVQPVIIIDGIANTTYRVNSIEFGITVNEESIINILIMKPDGLVFYNTTSNALPGNRVLNIASDLEDGYYELSVNVTDRAGNNDAVKLYFTVHISSFDLNWMLEARTPRTIPVVDENGLPWAGTLAGPGNQILSVVKFTCDKPGDIVYMSFSYKVNDTSATDPNLPVHQWVYWDNLTQSWKEIPTAFNYLSFSWEATAEGNVTFITIMVTGETLNVAEITDTNLFPTPAMELVTVIVSMFSSLLLRRKLGKTKTRIKMKE